MEANRQMLPHEEPIVPEMAAVVCRIVFDSWLSDEIGELRKCLYCGKAIAM